MPDNYEGAEVVRKKWNESFQRKLDEQPRQFAWQSEIVHRHLIANYLDGASVSSEINQSGLVFSVAFPAEVFISEIE